MRLVSNALRNYVKENGVTPLFQKYAEANNDVITVSNDWKDLLPGLYLKIACHRINEAVVFEGVDAFEKIK